MSTVQLFYKLDGIRGSAKTRVTVLIVRFTTGVTVQLRANSDYMKQHTSDGFSFNQFRCYFIRHGVTMKSVYVTDSHTQLNRSEDFVRLV